MSGDRACIWQKKTPMLIALGAILLLSAIPGAWAQEDRSQIRSFDIDRKYVEPTVYPVPSEKPILKPKKYQDNFPGGPYYLVSTPAKMTRKLVRGVHNIGLGWVEIPKNVIEQMVYVDPFTGFFTGIGKGAVQTVSRMGVGGFEVLTFFAEIPANYGPIYKPEFVLGEYTD